MAECLHSVPHEQVTVHQWGTHTCGLWCLVPVDLTVDYPPSDQCTELVALGFKVALK